MLYSVWTTGSCNLRCTYCYEGTGKASSYMNRETAKHVISFMDDDFRKWNDDEIIINFHGGEPFLNFEIIKFFMEEIERAFQSIYHVNFTATTNATLLTDDIINYIKSKSFDLTVSLDGNSQTHNANRHFADGSGSHFIAMENSKKILEFNPNLRVRMTYNCDTVGDLSKNVHYLLEQGFQLIVPGIDSFDRRWDDSHIEILKRELIKIRKLSKKYLSARIGTCEKLSYKGIACSAGRTTKHFYYDGTIYPCMVSCGNPEFAIGDVVKGINKNRIEEIISVSDKNNEVCSGCDMVMFCNGERCKIINKIIMSNPYTPVPIDCAMTHIIHEINGVNVTEPGPHL